MKSTGIIFEPIVYGRNSPAALPALLTDGSRNGLNASFEGGLAVGDWALINDTIYVPLLNGTTDYLSVPDSSLLSFGRTVAGSDLPFSIVTWINTTDATEFPVIKKGVYNTSGEWRLLCNASDMMTFQIFDESVADCYIGRKTAALTGDEGAWINIGVSYAASAGNSTDIKIYRNGVAADNANSELNAGSYVAMENLTAAMEIGKDDTLFAEGSIWPQEVVKELKDATWFAAFYASTRTIYGV